MRSRIPGPRLALLLSDKRAPSVTSQRLLQDTRPMTPQSVTTLSAPEDGKHHARVNALHAAIQHEDVASSTRPPLAVIQPSSRGSQGAREKHGLGCYPQEHVKRTALLRDLFLEAWE